MKRRRVLFMQLSNIRLLIKKFALVILFLLAFVLMLLNKTDTILIDKTSSVATNVFSPVVDVLILPAKGVAQIYDYFKESTTDKIDDAMSELGGDYTEEEIRLVRIKFISEMAN